jgi:hypothetical protein
MKGCFPFWDRYCVSTPLIIADCVQPVTTLLGRPEAGKETLNLSIGGLFSTGYHWIEFDPGLGRSDPPAGLLEARLKTSPSSQIKADLNKMRQAAHERLKQLSPYIML